MRLMKFSLNRISIITILAISLSLIAGLSLHASTFDDNNNKILNNDSSGIFEPGYINAAKYKTEAIVDQAMQKPSLIDKIINYVQGKTTDDVKMEDAVIKMNPEPTLQKKSSSPNTTSRGTNANAVTVVPTANTNPADIPAYIRDSVQKYIMSQLNNAALSGDYQLKYSNGKYCAVWNESSSSYNGVKAQIFDSNGNAIATTITLSQWGNLDNVSTLSNGNIAVFWTDSSESSSKLEARIFDPGSNDMGTPITLSQNGWLKNVSTLSNGNIEVFWQDDTNSEYPCTLEAQILDSNGKAIAAPITLSQLGNLDNVSTLSNGNIAVFWTDYSESSSLEAQIIDPNGKAVASPITLGQNASSTYNITELSNGNIAVFWSKVNSDSTSSLEAQIIDPNDYAKNTAPITLSQRWGWAEDVSILPNGNIAVFWNDYDSSYNSLLKTQIIDPSGKTVADPITISQNGWMKDISTLSNGNIAIVWSDGSALNAQIIDPNDYAKNTTPITLSQCGGNLDNVLTLPNGNIAVFWNEYDSSYHSLLKTQIIDPSGKAVADPITLSQNGWMEDITTLSNGNIAIVWTDGSALYAQMIDPNDYTKNTAPVTLGQNIEGYDTIENFSTLANGDIAVFWQGMDLNNNLSLQSQALDSQGNFISTDVLKPQSDGSSPGDKGLLADPYAAQMNQSAISNLYYRASQDASSSGDENLTGIFKSLLSNKDSLNGIAEPAYNTSAGKILTDALGNSALSVPLTLTGDEKPGEMDPSMRLANIMNNPTDEQKLILDVVQSLIQEMDNVAVNKENKELQAEEDKIVEMAANYLLGQALPDLIKAGDVTGIKNLFQDLNTSKTKIMLEYQTAVTPYYEELRKMLQENAEGLQGKGILAKTITQEELNKLPPKEVSKILDMIRRDPDKTFGEEYILQQEAKYRIKYVEPGKKVLGERMKVMLKGFTQQLSSALEVKRK